jgi:hypothetical protein
VEQGPLETTDQFAERVSREAQAAWKAHQSKDVLPSVTSKPQQAWKLADAEKHRKAQMPNKGLPYKLFDSGEDFYSRSHRAELVVVALLILMIILDIFCPKITEPVHRLARKIFPPCTSEACEDVQPD